MIKLSEDIVKESIKCLANMEIKETTYQIARSVVLEEIERQKEVINGMIENEEKYNLEIIKLHSIIE